MPITFTPGSNPRARRSHKPATPESAARDLGQETEALRRDMHKLPGLLAQVTTREDVQALIEERLPSAGWRPIDVMHPLPVAGPAPVVNGDQSVTLPAGTQVQYAIPLAEGDALASVRCRHADGATPTGQLRAQVGVNSTSGTTAAVTVTPGPVTDFASSINFVTDLVTLGDVPPAAEDVSLALSLTNIGVEPVVVHRILWVV